MKRLHLALVVALTCAAAAAILASVASATPPAHFQFSFTSTATLTGACPFDITVDSAASGTGQDFFDQSGALIREHDNVLEQDVFSANGHSLTGVPYTFSIEFLFDSSGNVTHADASGVTERVPLPDGSQFIGAGQVDFAAHGFPSFILTPDHGASHNLDGFCAALSA